MGILVAFPIGILHAQKNPYRYGSPHYWMAQSTLHITDGKFDMAYEGLQKARKGYKAIGDVSYQVNAIGAMALLKSNLGEWPLALQHFHSFQCKTVLTDMNFVPLRGQMFASSKGEYAYIDTIYTTDSGYRVEIVDEIFDGGEQGRDMVDLDFMNKVVRKRTIKSPN